LAGPSEDAEKLLARLGNRLSIADFASLDYPDRRTITIIRLVELAGLRIAESYPVADRVALREIRARNALAPFIGQE